jgi:hypothetical protein
VVFEVVQESLVVEVFEVVQECLVVEVVEDYSHSKGCLTFS